MVASWSFYPAVTQPQDFFAVVLDALPRTAASAKRAPRQLKTFQDCFHLTAITQTAVKHEGKAARSAEYNQERPLKVPMPSPMITNI